jgi:hypothetical protein
LLRLKTSYLLVALLIVLGSTASRAQEDFYHPELEWKTIETEHFYVHFHDGAERTANVIAKVAEEVYDPVTSLYNHKPDGKVSFIVKDHDDISNGAAYFFENKIEIYAPSLDFEFRGTHNWLRNVVTHEFTHVVQIQTAMKFGRHIPSLYFQWLGYESERRPDVLYGYPNTIVSYPISGFIVPAWFAEGVAQYNRTDLRYDFWDTHRDMILRSYALDGNMLTWEQMSVFGKTSLGNESSYNSGFAFVSYIANRYGEEALKRISANLASLPTLTIGQAIEQAVGRPGADVYADWKAWVTSDYTRRVAPIQAALKEGTPFIKSEGNAVTDPGQRQKIESIHHPGTLPIGAYEDFCSPIADDGTGFANLYAVYSPDGSKVAYVSNKGADYFSLSSLYVFDFSSNTEKLVQGGVRSAPCWSPDGKMLYYSRASRENAHWSYQNDLYKFNIADEEETRLTHGKRAAEPVVSPDGKTVICVVDADGTTNLAAMNPDGAEFRMLTKYTNGEQTYHPRWMPKGDRIVYDYSIRDGRDILSIAPDGSDVRTIVGGADDSRSGVITPDGTKLVFASDRTGIFNLYALDFATTAVTQLTNVVGGAFYPTVNQAGDIVYSSYTSGGYKLVRMPASSVAALADPPVYLAPADSVKRVQDSPQFDWTKMRSYDDSNTPAFEAKTYKSKFTGLTLVPFLRVDNYNLSSSGIDMLKPGVYLFSNDILEKTGFFAGGSLNRKLERDLFLQFFYRGRIPGFFQIGLEPIASAELYNVSRKTNTFLTLPDPTLPPIPVDVTYDMFEFDFALNQPLFSQYNNAEFRYAHSRYSSALGSFINPATNDLVQSSGDLYLIANTLTLTFNLNAIVPASTMEINPIGRKITLKVSRELNKFGAVDSLGYRKYEISSTGLKPVYDNINFTRVELNWRESVPFLFKNHSLTASLRGGNVFGGPVDEFFDFYLGGLVGMKGYPFYGLSGNSIASFGLSYRFPIVSNIDLRIGHVYFDKLYASVYSDIGNAWTESRPALKDFKKDVGAEIRLEAWSFYSYPTRIFFNASYGLDQFTRFIVSRGENVTYGKEWRLYFGILFGFDLD